jgi:hypothetical protein
VVKNTSFDSDTGCFASAAEGINALLFDWSRRPRQLKSSDYDVREHRRDTKELSVLVSAISEAEGVFPLKEEDFLSLLSYFTGNNQS